MVSFKLLLHWGFLQNIKLSRKYHTLSRLGYGACECRHFFGRAFKVRSSLSGQQVARLKAESDKACPSIGSSNSLGERLLEARKEYQNLSSEQIAMQTTTKVSDPALQYHRQLA